jgi:cytoskeletal protein RodZ
LAANFDTLKKIKTLGFISILEREYTADLNALREEALAYYNEHDEHNEHNGFSLGLPSYEEKRGRSKLFLLVVLVLLGYASWYFFAQFDKKHLSQLIPFMDEQRIEDFTTENKGKEEDPVADLSIANVVVNDTKTNVVIEETVEEIAVQETMQSSDVSVKQQSVSIVPVGKLWFGVIDTETKQREHFLIEEAYELDVETKSWLVATSSAPFSLVNSDETRDFNDAQEHYFKIDKNGIQILSKSEYVAQGGWDQW